MTLVTRSQEQKLREVWSNMHKRCYMPSHSSYDRYGAKGIRVCSQWNEFKKFKEDMGYPPTRKHQLDRINTLLDYFPENCRWVTSKQNANNRSSNIVHVIDGDRYTLKQLAEMVGIDYKRLYDRVMDLKWDIRKALFTPVGRPR
jgi:hypothetical protein